MADAFICHAGKDRDFALKLWDSLVAHKREGRIDLKGIRQLQYGGKRYTSISNRPIILLPLGVSLMMNHRRFGDSDWWKTV
jgi:hypothetical protein